MNQKEWELKNNKGDYVKDEKKNKQEIKQRGEIIGKRS